MPTKSRPLRFFFVLMVMFGITTTLHGLSPLATYGLGSAFFLLLAVFAFLIPAGMVASELATSHQQDGGVFVWVSAAFGESAGFLATWLQWLQDVIFWTVILTGSAAMLAIGFGWEAGANNKIYTVAVVVGTVWFASLLTMFGMKSTGWAGTIGSLAGTILPGLALVAFAVVYLVQGNPSNMSFAPDTFWPDLPRPWQIPGGRVGLALVCAIGIVFSLAAIGVGFLPPGSLGVSATNYVVVLSAALILCLAAPAILILRRNRGHSKTNPVP